DLEARSHATLDFFGHTGLRELRRDADGVADRARVGGAVRLHDGPAETEQQSATGLARVELPAEGAQALAQDQAGEAAENALLEHRAQARADERTEALHALQDQVADEAVAHDDVDLAAREM